ncbi:DUF3055 domain-containing protein [Alicyclobacillus cycloheptanicus]|uniref:DUF3055 domain-containing protein n=2 Tax=Alicyclobacillus cycloheptanicus TaxID=1457 RepID=A0ABT9XLP6_9BACL|nr:DUF3055 domain-containing protein [Alicyclobacillus cycloheptanicus]MDQ0191231.1 hypothetical protein [Alicyclobacillus cycloheptanicus]WDM02795.1 DUF3055 domain-containing protein [Alicyclobacillus cycloheptanicus]
MQSDAILYDDTEQTSTRFVGYTGDHSRFDVAITTTDHFYGKKLVFVIQSGRTAIMNDDDAANLAYVMDIFNIQDEAEGAELSEFLQANL